MGSYILSEAWSGVNWVDLMAAQGAFGTDFYDRSTRTMVGTILWAEYRPVIKIGRKGEIRPIHSAPSLGQSIGTNLSVLLLCTARYQVPIISNIPERFLKNLKLKCEKIENETEKQVTNIFILSGTHLVGRNVGMSSEFEKNLKAL